MAGLCEGSNEPAGSLKASNEARQPRGRFLICSDSSDIQSLQSFNCDDPLVLRTQELFHTLLSSDYEIGVVWIPGHVGIPGNEAADAAARADALNGSLVY
ncbi:hypothetical protein ANN_12681 [Periplaneta americana]|uniref:RNase H type-1 domain-containing protein n=1 Tax=Periplaneta americana TaxID=6978 RepID=A0ABQ8TJZ6_PERAM|nr:hypothetical protein ANN_12681 [Periplaneta americana]